MESGPVQQKAAKARRYAQERGRVSFLRFAARFRGEHGHYTVSYEGGRWGCTCPFFSQREVCSHTLALREILGEMLPHPRTLPKREQEG